MSIQLTDTQRCLLAVAAQRDDRLIPPPSGLKGGAMIKVVAKLMDAGLVRETPTEHKAVVWRRDNRTNKTFALKLTAARLKACSSSPKAEVVADTSKAVDAKRTVGRQKSTMTEAAAGSENRLPRDGSKICEVIGLL